MAFHTLTLQNYSNLVSSVPIAITSLKSELEKIEIEIYHARMNNLRYVRYKYFLDYKQITIDPLSNIATVSVTEGHDVVFEISDPIVSTMRNLEHVITLKKELGGWKIVSDNYADYLWRLLNATGATKEEIYKRIDQSKERPTGMKELDVRQAWVEQGTIESLLGTYDRSGAVDYAHDWAYDRNPSYYDFENDRGDYTNFVSQAMHEGGGISETASGGGIGEPGWYYVDVYDRAAAWT